MRNTTRSRGDGAACDRFEREGVLLLEQGRPLPEHMATCPDCVAARQAHERLAGRLAVAGRALEAPRDWQRRVRERLDHERRHARGRQEREVLVGGNWLGRAPGMALVAALVLVIAGLGYFLHQNSQDKKRLMAENAHLQRNIDESLRRINDMSATTQDLLNQLAGEHDEARRLALQAEIRKKRDELEAEKAKLAELNARKGGGDGRRTGGAAGAAKPTGPSGISRKCDPHDPLCGI